MIDDDDDDYIGAIAAYRRDHPEPETNNEAETIKAALRMMVRVFEKSHKTPEQQKEWDKANAVLTEYFNPSDILR